MSYLRPVVLLPFLFSCSIVSAEILGTVTVTSDEAPVKRGTETLSIVKKGDTLKVTKIKGDWFGVSQANGWIHRSHVRFDQAEEPTEESTPAAGDSWLKEHDLKPESLVAAVKTGGRDLDAAMKQLLEALGKTPGASQRAAAAKELRPVLDALVDSATKDITSPLTHQTAQVFMTLGQPCPQAAAFVKRLISDDQPSKDFSVRLAFDILRQTKVRDDELKDVILARLPSLSEFLVQDALPSLAEQYPGDPAVSKAVMKMVEDPDASKASAGLQALEAVSLDPESARKIAARAVESALTKEQDANARAYRRVFVSQPSTYRNALSPEQRGKLVKALQDGDEAQGQEALLMLLATGSTLDETMVSAILQRYGKASRRGANLLAALGFASASTVPAAKRPALMKSLSERDLSDNEAAFAGLASLVIRSAEDPEKAAGEIEKTARQQTQISQWDYWRGLRGLVSDELLDPKEWKAGFAQMDKNMPGYEAMKKQAVRGLLLCLIAYPDTKEAGWLIDMAVEGGLPEDALLNPLWEIRGRAPGVKDAKRLKDWLGKAASRGDRGELRCMAAGVLASVFGDKENAAKLVVKTLEDCPNLTTAWSPAIEVMLECAPESDALKQFREAQTGPDRKFILWLLDVRSGQKAGDVPTDSLIQALRRQDVRSWIPGLAQARGKVTKEQVATLRNPQVFTAVENERVLQRYLGAVDCLDLAYLVTKKPD